MIKICISVTSHALDPSPLSQTVTSSRTPSPERAVLYGRPLILIVSPVAETWRRVWGHGKFFGGPRFLNFREKNPFSRQKFLMTFFSHRRGFSDFPYLYQIFRVFTMLNVVYDLFLRRKTPFLLFTYFPAHPTTLLLKILAGDGCMGRPPPQIFWGPSPQSP